MPLLTRLLSVGYGIGMLWLIQEGDSTTIPSENATEDSVWSRLHLFLKNTFIEIGSGAGHFSVRKMAGLGREC